MITFLGCSKADHTKNEITDDHKITLNTALEKFNMAFKDSDIATLDTMVTTNYRHTNNSSRVIDKKTWFNYLTKRKQDVDTGNLVVVDYLIDEKDIQFYENLAIVTARVKVKSIKSGIEHNNEYRVTNIWIYESDQWKRAGFHDGKIK